MDDALDLHRVGVGDFVLLPLEATTRTELRVAASLADHLGLIEWSVYQIAAARRAELESTIVAFRAALAEGLEWCASHSVAEIVRVLRARFADEHEVEHLIDSTNARICGPGHPDRTASRPSGGGQWFVTPACSADPAISPGSCNQSD